MEILRTMLIDGMEYRLQRDEEGIALTDGNMVLRGDFSSMKSRIRADRLQTEMLVRAARIRGAEGPLTAIDATAGLGEDSLLLAAAGYRVSMYEYNPVMAALLRDALRKAAGDPALADPAGRMILHEEDSVQALREMAGRLAAGGEQSTETAPDLILLDPMFPAKQKHAFSKKKLQLFQKLETPCASEDALLEAAIRLRPQKIIIKRPLKGPYLAGVRPGYSISGKTIRYDCIVFPR